MWGLMVCWEVRTRRADSGGGRPSGVRLLSSRRKLSRVESQSSTEFVTGKVARVSSSLFGKRLLLSYRERAREEFSLVFRRVCSVRDTV